ncbi:MAG: hypothetical protein M3Z65_04350 [Chloroflexota bacterium]|nr:hypothetical protein [Chloroflexota bacterium]
MQKLRPRGALTLAIVLMLGACTPIAVPAPKSGASIVVPTELPNGRVEIAVAAAYPLEATASVPVAILVARGTVTGPLTARVLASGFSAEVPVRDLLVKPAVTTAKAKNSTTVTWDTRDATGVVVPAGAYTLVLEFRVDDGGPPRVFTAAATLELR